MSFGPARQTKYSLTDGQSAVHLIAKSAPITVTCAAGAGATATVEFTCDSASEVEAGTADWFPWAHGNVSASTKKDDVLLGPAVALRFAVAGGGAEFAVAES